MAKAIARTINNQGYFILNLIHQEINLASDPQPLSGQSHATHDDGGRDAGANPLGQRAVLFKTLGNARAWLKY